MELFLEEDEAETVRFDNHDDVAHKITIVTQASESIPINVQKPGYPTPTIPKLNVSYKTQKNVKKVITIEPFESLYAAISLPKTKKGKNPSMPLAFMVANKTYTFYLAQVEVDEPAP